MCDCDDLPHDGRWLADTRAPAVAGPQRCPGCGSDRVTVFYTLADVPVHSVTLVSTRQQALDFPRGDIALCACGRCGFVYNTAFDPAHLAYHTKYESTQAYSPTFNAFHEYLAKRLIDRFDLHGKQLIEIGGGHGEFLTLLCELGDNAGTGFDPAYLPGRSGSPGKPQQTTFVKDYYSEQYSRYQCDFLCCKMTLEHIRDTAGFVRTVRAALGTHSDTTVFFQVPNADRVLRDAAFWDIYYEHCSYFTAPALQALFRRSGFDIIETTTAYDNQYLMIAARPACAVVVGQSEPPAVRHALGEAVAAFSCGVRHSLDAWRQKLDDILRSGRRAVVWGAGSKAVSFLTTLGVIEAIEYAIDINPHKHGTFLAGTGQAVVVPDFLEDYRPDTVIVMNPVYWYEIRAQFDRMGLSPELIALENTPEATAGQSSWSPGNSHE